MAALRALHASVPLARHAAPRRPTNAGSRLVVILCFAAAALLVLAGSAPAQEIVENLWETNAPVCATAVSGNTLYIGGFFNYVGPHTGSGVLLDATSGAPTTAFPRVEGGAVDVAVPDGLGGWYIGGAFTRVGGVPHNHLAHVSPGGGVDPWDPNADGEVFAMVIAGSTIYLGGSFASVGGAARSRIAELEIGTGLATPWDPGADGPVLALAVSGGTVFAGGAFRNAGGQPRNRIAALDAATGLATVWDASADSTVRALAVVGDVVYAGGYFQNVGGQPRIAIAALDLVTGLATAWNPSASATSGVFAIVPSGGLVYVAGSFGSMGGQSRACVAALDPVTGLATAFNPAGVPSYMRVYALAVGGGTVYAGFTDSESEYGNVKSNDPSCVTAMDATTGARQWKCYVNDAVDALAVTGNSLFAGGALSSVGGVKRTYVAALDRTTGQATAWNPVLDYTYYPRVNAIIVSGGLVYIGGWFNIGLPPQPDRRQDLAVLDATTGALTGWSTRAGGMQPEVRGLALSGNTLYVAGAYLSLGGQTRYGLGALDVTTGAVLPWNPSPDNDVYSVAVSGNTVYAGGYFGGMGGQPRNGIAAIDAATGAVLPWDPNADVVNGNYDVAVSAILPLGGVVYVGGSYTTIGGQPRSGVAAIDATTGLATSWNPNPSGYNPFSLSVRALVTAGDALFVGGCFTSIGGEPHGCLGLLDVVTGATRPWSTDVVPHWMGVQTLAYAGNTLYVGGYLNAIGGESRHYVGAVTVDQAVPVEVALASAVAKADRVSLVWHAAQGAITATVYRRTITTDWQAIGSVSADGTGALVYEDRDVAAGARYGYRLGIGAAGQEQYAGETWVEVPCTAALALAGLRPNPTTRDLSVAFTLPSASPAKLEVLDIAGRIVLAREVGALGAGSHTLKLGEGRSFAPGVYVLRLTQGGRTLTARGAVIR